MRTEPATPAPLAAQLVALEALSTIGRTFAHLPGADLQISLVGYAAALGSIGGAR